jgi:hypothetical protein
MLLYCNFFFLFYFYCPFYFLSSFLFSSLSSIIVEICLIWIHQI